MSLLTCRTFLAWKEGEERDDCQDSLYSPPSPLAAQAYAVADGATTSFFSRAWASILTRRFGENAEQALSDWSTWLQAAQDEWRQEVERAARAEHASFLVVNGLIARRPAAAAMAGVVINGASSDRWSWRGIVLGDSCVFALRNDACFQSWHIQSSNDFSNVVKAAESWPKADAHVPTQFGSHPWGAEAMFGLGDSLVIATDALSKWLLSRHEHGHPVWGTLLDLRTENDFNTFISQARMEATKPLENDDVALIALTFGSSTDAFGKDKFVSNPRAEAMPKRRGVSEQSGTGSRNAELSTAPSPIDEESDAISITSVLRRKNRPILITLLVVGFLFIVFFIRLQLQTSRIRQLRHQNEVLEGVIRAMRNQKWQSADPHLQQLKAENEQLEKQLQKAEANITRPESPAEETVIDGEPPPPQ